MYYDVHREHCVICNENGEQMEKTLESWRYALERREMQVSRNKTEYRCVNVNEAVGKVRMQLVKVDEFKYLESTIENKRECIIYKVENRVEAGWNG